MNEQTTKYKDYKVEKPVRETRTSIDGPSAPIKYTAVYEPNWS